MKLITKEKQNTLKNWLTTNKKNKKNKQSVFLYKECELGRNRILKMYKS